MKVAAKAIVLTVSGEFMTVEIHAIVYGNVQGVGFRAAVSRHAKSLGLLGITRNMLDGTVEISLLGNVNTIEQFFSKLRAEYGPEYISSIVEEQVAPSHQYEGFRILP